VRLGGIKGDFATEIPSCTRGWSIMWEQRTSELRGGSCGLCAGRTGRDEECSIDLSRSLHRESVRVSRVSTHECISVPQLINRTSNIRIRDEANRLKDVPGRVLECVLSQFAETVRKKSHVFRTLYRAVKLRAEILNRGQNLGRGKRRHYRPPLPRIAGNPR
jgi:hypothetical protein